MKFSSLTVWRDPPMHRALMKNRISLFFFFGFLGGRWDGLDYRDDSALVLLFDKMISGELVVDDISFPSKYWLLHSRDDEGKSIVHHATYEDDLRCMTSLLNCRSGVNFISIL
jgi:hypothetical protein